VFLQVIDFMLVLVITLISSLIIKSGFNLFFYYHTILYIGADVTKGFLYNTCTIPIKI